MRPGLLFLLAFLFFAGGIKGQTSGRRALSHPDNSSGSKSEKPQGLSENFRLSYTAAVKKYIERSLDSTDKLFHFWDAEAEEEWTLQLMKVHDEQLVSLGHDRYFAPADFLQKNSSKELEDTPFVLDIYGMKVAEGWEIEDIYIRSVNEKPRYSYDKEYNRVFVEPEKNLNQPDEQAAPASPK